MDQFAMLSASRAQQDARDEKEALFAMIKSMSEKLDLLTSTVEKLSKKSKGSQE